MKRSDEGKSLPQASSLAGIPFFVLTRVAESFSREDSYLNSPEWIARQCRFLRDFSRPSLELQSDQGFRWLLSVSDKLSSENRSLISEAVEPVGSLIVQNGDEHSGEVFNRALSGIRGPYLTALLDYDDVLHPKYVELAKLNFDPDYAVFSFVSGLVYDRDLKIAASWPHVSNTFVFSRGVGGSNIFELGNHTQLERRFGVQMKRINLSYPMWLKIVHSSNLGGDKITSLDKPIFGSLVNRHFPSSDFPITFSFFRDTCRAFCYRAYRTKAVVRFLVKSMIENSRRKK